MQHRGDVVDRRHVDGVHHGGLVDVAHERDLALVRLGDGPVAAQHERVGLDADRAQGGDGVLRRLGLLLARGAHERHERDVHEEHVLAAELVAHLAGGLDERLRLDVADGAADLGDDHVGLRVVSVACRRMRRLISSVMCGMTCTVSPRYSPRRSLAMTVE